jgi:hypothetical protein
MFARTIFLRTPGLDYAPSQSSCFGHLGDFQFAGLIRRLLAEAKFAGVGLTSSPQAKRVKSVGPPTVLVSPANFFPANRKWGSRWELPLPRSIQRNLSSLPWRSFPLFRIGIAMTLTSTGSYDHKRSRLSSVSCLTALRSPSIRKPMPLNGTCPSRTAVTK